MASIASIINWQNNVDAEVYGVAIVTLTNQTGINTLQDVVGKIVSISPSRLAFYSNIRLHRSCLWFCIRLCLILLHEVKSSKFIAFCFLVVRLHL